MTQIVQEHSWNLCGIKCDRWSRISWRSLTIPFEFVARFRHWKVSTRAPTSNPVIWQWAGGGTLPGARLLWCPSAAVAVSNYKRVRVCLICHQWTASVCCQRAEYVLDSSCSWQLLERALMRQHNCWQRGISQFAQCVPNAQTARSNRPPELQQSFPAICQSRCRSLAYSRQSLGNISNWSCQHEW